MNENLNKNNDTAKLTSVATLANAIELTTQVIMQVAGNTVGNTLDGETVTPDALYPTVAAKLQRGMAKYMEGSK